MRGSCGERAGVGDIHLLRWNLLFSPLDANVFSFRGMTGNKQFALKVASEEKSTQSKLYFVFT